MDKRTPENRAVKLTLAVTQEILRPDSQRQSARSPTPPCGPGSSERTFHVWMANGSEEDAEPMYRNFFERVEARQGSGQGSHAGANVRLRWPRPGQQGRAPPSKISKVVRTGPSGNHHGEAHHPRAGAVELADSYRLATPKSSPRAA